MKRQFLIFVLSVIFLNACSKTTHKPEIPTEVKKAIIFVPGYKGTSLVDAKTERPVWLTARNALLNLNSLQIEHPGLELGQERLLRPKEVLHSIEIIPWLFDFPVYRNWLNELEKKFGSTSTIILFPYDWRRSNADHLPRLSRLVAQLRMDGIEEVSIVAHSMGALLVAAYLRFGGADPRSAPDTWEGAAMIDRVVLAAAPFQGTIIMFHDMLYGTQTGRNRSLLSQTSLSTFGSVYELLPLQTSEALIASDTSNLTGEIFNANTWEEQSWGIFENSQDLSPEILAARRDYLRRSLSNGERFLRRINQPSTMSPDLRIKLLSISSSSIETLEKAVFAPEQKQIAFQESDVEKLVPHGLAAKTHRPGDGLLSAESTRLPSAFSKVIKSTEVSLPAVHSEILNEKAVQEVIFQFLGSESQ